MAQGCASLCQVKGWIGQSVPLGIYRPRSVGVRCWEGLAPWRARFSIFPMWPSCSDPLARDASLGWTAKYVRWGLDEPSTNPYTVSAQRPNSAGRMMAGPFRPATRKAADATKGAARPARDITVRPAAPTTRLTEPANASGDANAGAHD